MAKSASRRRNSLFRMFLSNDGTLCEELMLSCRSRSLLSGRSLLFFDRFQRDICPVFSIFIGRRLRPSHDRVLHSTEFPISSLSRAWNIHCLSVFGNSPSGNCNSSLRHFRNEIIIAQRRFLRFSIDDFLQLYANRIPSDFSSVRAHRATDKKFPQRKNPRGVCSHFSSTARLMVVTCTPTRSAICCIFNGSIASGPSLRK